MLKKKKTNKTKMKEIPNIMKQMQTHHFRIKIRFYFYIFKTTTNELNWL